MSNWMGMALAMMTLCLVPEVSFGQILNPVDFHVTVDAANIRDAASRTAAVVARVSRGTRLPVTGFAGEWFLVSIGGLAPFGREAGFIHRSVGVLEKGIEPPEAESVEQGARSAADDDGAAPTMGDGGSEPTIPPVPPAPVVAAERTHVSQQPLNLRPAGPYDDKRLGVGARFGGFALGIGGSFRYWPTPKVGIQTELSRYSVGVSGVGLSGSTSVTEIAPSLIYRISKGDPDADVAVRPYVMGGLAFYRTSISTSIAGLGTESESQTDTGFQIVGGAELRFEELPRLSISADLGYYSTVVPYIGVSVGGFAYGARVHWYF